MNARNANNNTLEQALQAFETNMASIRAEREKLQSRMYEREHELNHEWKKSVVTPGALHYDFDAFTSGTVSIPTVSKSEWHQQRHVIMAALAANPFGDADRAALANAQLDAISAAAAESDADLTAEIAAAQKAMKAAQARYVAAVNARRASGSTPSAECAGPTTTPPDRAGMLARHGAAIARKDLMNRTPAPFSAQSAVIATLQMQWTR